MAQPDYAYYNVIPVLGRACCTRVLFCVPDPLRNILGKVGGSARPVYYNGLQSGFCPSISE